MILPRCASNVTAGRRDAGLAGTSAAGSAAGLPSGSLALVDVPPSRRRYSQRAAGATDGASRMARHEEACVFAPARRRILLAAQIDPGMFGEMRWRMIGPFRGGRTVAAVGVVKQPNVFYIGVNNGGVWKTHRLRPHVDADLRRPADRLDRRDRRRAVRSEHHLRRQRRRPAAARSLHRRRHVQVHRRRQDLDAPRPARRRSRSRRSPSIRTIRIASSSPCSAIRTVRTQSAASSARPTAARRSRKCSTRTRTPAASTSSSIRRTRRPSTPRCGRRGRGRGRTAYFGGPAQRPVQVDRRRHDLERS